MLLPISKRLQYFSDRLSCGEQEFVLTAIPGYVAESRVEGIRRKQRNKKTQLAGLSDASPCPVASIVQTPLFKSSGPYEQTFFQL
jgi:hypothetical protein